MKRRKVDCISNMERSIDDPVVEAFSRSGYVTAGFQRASADGALASDGTPPSVEDPPPGVA